MGKTLSGELSCMLTGLVTNGSDTPFRSQKGLLFKERICSLWSKFFSLRVDPVEKRGNHANGRVASPEGVPIHFNLNSWDGYFFQKGEVRVLQLDLSDLKTIKSKASEAVAIFGGIDILINNAGISYRGCIVDTDLDIDQKIMAVNYFGQVALTKGNVLIKCLYVCVAQVLTWLFSF